ncbi:MAG: hypothetical protein PWP15_1112 [Methanothermococcus sp.]|uniref:hypothetical protein n=1 Tax=Methanothermococcus sp. TaxID=2614238 RepID=UPI0025908B0D|nr:hypothetical protein [Methanothermococcus sp.]MDK2790605.1 hypothetical protein [Methanothermococcus sp.]
MTPNIVKKQKLYVGEYINKQVPYTTETETISISATWNYNNPATLLTQSETTDTRNYLSDITFVNWAYTDPSTILTKPAIIETIGLQNIQIQTAPDFVGYDEISINDKYFITSDRTESFLRAVNDVTEIHATKYQTEEITPDGVSNVFNHSLSTADFAVYVNGFIYTNVVKTSTTVEFDFVPRRMDFIELKATISNDLDFSVILQGTTEQETELTNYTELAWKERKTEKNSQHADYSRTIRTTDIKYDISLSFNDIKQKKEFFMEYQDKDFMLHVQNEDGTNEYFAICKIIDNSEKNYFNTSYSLSVESTNYWRDI